MPVVTRPDPFNAVLLSSPALAVTLEQRNYIREILDIACSDSKFAEKAYDAITYVLTGGNSVSIPLLNALNPSTVAIGEPSFDIHILGSKFTPDSVIVFNGYEEPTTFVNETELTTGVNMDVWQAPAVVPIHVLNANGVMSDPLDFSFTAAQVVGTATKKLDEVKKVMERR